MALRGWAIPAATDIAFSLGVLAALGSRVPLALKVFLTTLAIVDDLGAIVIIAIFYTGHLSFAGDGAGGRLHRWRWRASTAPACGGSAPYHADRRWCCGCAVLKSGVHATLAGVVLAMFIPLKSAGEADAARPAIGLEHALKPWSAWFILPVFAFANAGLSLAGLSLASLVEPVPLGIVAGLFLGKQVGIVLGAGLLIVLGVAALPAGATWRQPLRRVDPGRHRLHHEPVHRHAGLRRCERATSQVRLGVLAGSLLSALVGYAVLRWPSRP